MPLRRLAPLVLVGLTACFVDVGAGASNPDGSSTAPGTDSSAGTDDAGDVSDTKHASSSQGATTATEAETTGDDPTTGGPDPTASTTTMTTDPSTTAMTMTMDPVTTDEPGSICGNGVLEPGEDCDDGNFDNIDFCLADCTPASCDDGYINQGESDNGCGGPCPPCNACLACNDNDDCEMDFSCENGVCNNYHVVEFNWSTDCGTDDSFFVKVPLGNFAGQWRVEALGGGGRVTDVGAWGWMVSCTGFDLDGFGAAFAHPSAEDAYAAIDPKSILAQYNGGTTACGILEDFCDDNSGSSLLGFSLACD